MPAYESNSFRPPAPVALVSVRSPESGASPNAKGVLLQSPGSLRAWRGAHPGKSQKRVGYSEGVTQQITRCFVCNAFGVITAIRSFIPRVARRCRLPWALECNRFAVRALSFTFLPPTTGPVN
jgi:hypothetical protein